MYLASYALIGVESRQGDDHQLKPATLIERNAECGLNVTEL
jgi:hypothetical protein